MRLLDTRIILGFKFNSYEKNLSGSFCSFKVSKEAKAINPVSDFVSGLIEREGISQVCLATRKWCARHTVLFEEPHAIEIQLKHEIVTLTKLSVWMRTVSCTDVFLTILSWIRGGERCQMP